MTNGELATLLALVRARVEDGTARDIASALGNWKHPELGEWFYPEAAYQALYATRFYGQVRTRERLAAIDRAILRLESQP